MLPFVWNINMALSRSGGTSIPLRHSLTSFNEENQDQLRDLRVPILGQTYIGGTEVATVSSTRQVARLSRHCHSLACGTLSHLCAVHTMEDTKGSSFSYRCADMFVLSSFQRSRFKLNSTSNISEYTSGRQWNSHVYVMEDQKLQRVALSQSQNPANRESSDFIQCGKTHPFNGCDRIRTWPNEKGSSFLACRLSLVHVYSISIPCLFHLHKESIPKQAESRVGHEISTIAAGRSCSPCWQPRKTNDVPVVSRG